MTLIQTARLNGVNPMAYLADVLERRCLGPDQAESNAHAAALELDSHHIRHDHQPSGLAAGSAAAPIVNSNPAPSPPQRLPSSERAGAFS
jgi:IS66 C-terminal element